MREKLIYLLGAIAAILLVRNLYVILLGLPDELNQGAIYRIFFFHFPSAITSSMGALGSMVASVLFLWKRNFIYDSIAVACTEITLLFGTVVLATGMIWARIIWGVWWAWDARLTWTLVCWLLYASYFLLRQATEEPSMRARFSAVLSIFTYPTVLICYKSIEWWRTQHPGPVITIRGGGGMAPGMEAAAYWNIIPLLLLSIVFVMIRSHQESTQRELDGLRRMAHGI